MIRKLLLLVVSFGLCVSVATAAEQVSLVAGNLPERVELVESNIDRTVLHFGVNRFATDEVEINGQAYTVVTLGERALLQERGLPALPVIRESIVIPDDAEMSIRVLDARYSDFEGIDLVPSKGALTRDVNPALVPWHFDDFYGSDAWFPARVADLGDPYIMRDLRGAVVKINPFQYNAASRTLRVYTSVTVEVVASGSGRVNVLADRPEALQRDFDQIYANHFLNYENVPDRYVSVPEFGRMLVISADQFASAIQPLVDWKNQQGIPTTLVNLSEIGSSGSAIQSHIQGVYNSEGVTFVLLVGDYAQMPSLSNDGAPADPMFGLLAGSDSYPEAFIGRFSAENNSQVQTQVTKTIEYERDAQAAADWYHKGTGIGSSEGNGIGDDGEADWVHLNNIRADLLAFTYTEVDQIYDPGASASQVTSAVNNGRSIINYTGHGSTTAWSTTGFSSSNVNSLTNDNMLPFIVSVACVNGAFHSGTCFAEAWLRATHNSEMSGAVAMYASTVNQQWATPMCGQDEIADLLVAEEKYTYGGLCFNGSCQMMDEYGSNGQTEFKNWHIFGDPSLRVRTDTPTAIDVSHADNIDPMAETFTVETDPGALAALSYNGAFIGSAIADAGGTAQITVVGEIPDDDITLTVSGFNKFTAIEALPTGPVLYPTCDVLPVSFNVIAPYNGSTSAWLHISNNGEEGSVLHYELSVIDPDILRGDKVPSLWATAGGRNMSGSEVTADLSEYLPGQTVDILITATNASDDNEWITDITLDFPSGVVVNSATDMVGGSGDGLTWNGATGDGANVEWNDPDGGWGEVYPDESCSATVNVTFAGSSGDVTVPWTIVGDDWGSNPHSVSGELVFTMSGPNITVNSPNGGEEWAIGDVEAINFTAAGGPTSVLIELHRGDLSGWETVAAGIPADAGTYSWEVIGPVSGNCRVRISDEADPGLNDVSDADFTIFRPLDWIILSSTEGDVADGGTDDILVSFEGAGLPLGSYLAEIIVDNNAGDDVIVPVSFTVGDGTAAGEAPLAFGLGQNHPNPFNPTTTIRFSLPDVGAVNLEVFDVGGRLVRTLIEGAQPSGQHTVVWNGRDDSGEALASGLYFYRLRADGKQETRKMMLLK